MSSEVGLKPCSWDVPIFKGQQGQTYPWMLYNGLVSTVVQGLEKAIRMIVIYLVSSKDHVNVFNPNKEKGIGCFVNADFAVGWRSADADNVENVM